MPLQMEPIFGKSTGKVMQLQQTRPHKPMLAEWTSVILFLSPSLSQDAQCSLNRSKPEQSA